MSKRFSRKSLFFIATLICVLSVFFASPVFAAASIPIPSKPSGLVVSSNWIADSVGQMILDKGGNAIDAAAAVGFALAVVHPTAGNIGGGGFAIIHLTSGDTHALDYREMAPGSADKWMFVDTKHVSFDINNPNTFRARRYVNPVTSADMGLASLYGPLASGVPGSVAGLNEMVRRFGSGKLTRAEIMEPAIKLAENGFRLTAGTATSLNGSRTVFNNFEGSKKYFTKDGNGGGTFAAGDVFVQKALAETFKRIAASGDAGFYSGPVADMIVADMVKYGGIITHKDLANYKAVWRDPAKGTYRGYKIFSMSPPSSGGTHIVQMLNTIENEDVKALGFQSKRTIWLMTEAMRYAYADRSEFMADPDFVFVPVDKLTSKDYAKEIHRKMLSHDLKAIPSTSIGPGFTIPLGGNNTTHYSVIDNLGNAVAITTTINFSFGSRHAVDGAGFFLNDEMDDLTTVPGQPNGFGLIQGEANCVEPGKRPLSCMSPSIVLSSDNKIFLLTGSPGGSQILNTVFNVIVNAIDHGMNVSEAVYAPRTHMQWLPDELRYETLFGFNNDTIAALRSMDYTLTTGSQGDAPSIMVATNGAVTGKNDPRAFYDPPTIPLDLGPAVQGLETYSVGSVDVAPKTATLESGKSQLLTATIVPWYATNKNVTWTTSDNTLATVANGMVVANTTGKSGNVTITATAEGNVTDRCVVTISPVAVTEIVMNKSSITLVTGASETLTANVVPANATSKDVAWSTSDNTVATVSSGTVTANTSKAGTASITATTGSFTATCTVTVNATIPPGGGKVTLPGGTEVNLPGGTTTSPNGTITLPPDEGGTAKTQDGMEIEIPGGSVITPDGMITFPPNKDGSLKLPGAEANLPGGTVITPDGTIKLPTDKGNTMTTSDGTEIEFPGGTVIWPDGTVNMPPDKTAVVTTSDGKLKAQVSGVIKVESDSSITLSNATVTASDKTKIEFLRGSMTEYEEGNAQYLSISIDDGNALVTYPDGKSKTVSKGSSIRMNPDGSVTAGKGSGGGGGGCNVGLALLAVAATGSLMLFRRKKI